MKTKFTSLKVANRLNVNTSFRRRPFNSDDFSTYVPKSVVSPSVVSPSVVSAVSSQSGSKFVFWPFLVVGLLSILFLLSSCGSPQTSIKVRNNAEGTATDISVTQGDGGSTSVTVSPSSKMALDSVKFNINHK